MDKTDTSYNIEDDENDKNNKITKKTEKKDIIKKIKQYFAQHIKMQKKKKILVLGGGGIKGIGHIGVLSALEKLGILDDIEIFAGTSVGALVIGMYIIGYSPNDLWRLVNGIDLSKIKSLEILEIINNYGIDTGKNVVYIMKRLINSKGYDPNISLMNLYNITKKKVLFTTVCLNTQEVCYLSHETHPNLPVWLAIRMSISIPVYYTPVFYEGKYYIDGGCINNYPIQLFDDRLDEVIGANLADSKKSEEKIDNLEKYLYLVLQCLMEGFNFNILNNYKNYTINVEMDSIISINYDIDKETKQKIYDAGFNATMQFFKEK